MPPSCPCLSRSAAKPSPAGRPTPTGHLVLPSPPATSSISVQPSPRNLLDVYQLGSKVGSGTFADVYNVVHKVTGRHYALKSMRKRRLQSQETLVHREVQVLALLAAHPNIVGLAEGEDIFFDTKHSYHLIMELCTGKELFDAILQRGFYTELDAVIVIAQVLDAIQFCHNHGVVHRDLKPENLLLKYDSPNAPIMVTDFGLSRVTEYDDQMFMTLCGTPAYCAPEVILGHGHGMPVDMWSLGCITYVLLCGYIPFWDESQPKVFNKIIQGHFRFDPEYWNAVSNEAKDFIRMLLVVDPTKRMTADQALHHRWIKHAPLDSLPGMSYRRSIDSVQSRESNVEFAKVNLVPTLKRGAELHPVSRFRAAVNSVLAMQRLRVSPSDMDRDIRHPGSDELIPSTDVATTTSPSLE